MGSHGAAKHHLLNMRRQPAGPVAGGRRVAPLHSNPFSTFKNSLQTVPDAISHAVGGPETSDETVPIIESVGISVLFAALGCPKQSTLDERKHHHGNQQCPS